MRHDHVPPAGSVPGDEARRGPPPAESRDAEATALEAWFDGACEPVNPGGVGTWGFVVREGGVTVAAESGAVAPAPGEAMTNNVAEYDALRRLLAWLGAERPGQPVTVRGDSSLVLNQVAGSWKANAPHLQRLRDECRGLLPALGPVRFEHVPRDANAEADRLTHEAYTRILEGDAALRASVQPHLATPEQVEACRRLGIPTYAFLGRREAARLLERARDG